MGTGRTVQACTGSPSRVQNPERHQNPGGHRGRGHRSRPDEACQGETPEMLACRDEILALVASIHAAEAELTARLAEFDRGEGWVGSGIRSLAHWLTVTCGFTTSEARTRAEASARRDELPTLFGAFDSGAFSLGALHCAQKVATPGNESEVTRVAVSATAPQAARTYAAFRKAVSAERRREDDLEERHHGCDDGHGAGEALSPGADDPDASNAGDPATWLRTWWDDYQYLRVDGRLDPTDGAAFKAVLDAVRHDAETGETAGATDTDDNDDSDETHAADTGRTAGTVEGVALPECSDTRGRLSWIDAFSRMTRLAGDALATAGVRGRWEDRFAVSVTIDAEVLLGLKQGCGLLADGAPVQPATVADWLPASTLQGLVCSRGAPLHMGRSIRVANRKMRRALRIRDGGCAFPGCDCTEYLDAHHVHGWANGALTDIDELVLLCRRHHRLFHKGEYGIIMRDGLPVFVSDVLGDGLPPPAPLGERGSGPDAPAISPTATKRTGESLTHYALDVFVALLFGTPENRSQVIRTLG